MLHIFELISAPPGPCSVRQWLGLGLAAAWRRRGLARLLRPGGLVTVAPEAGHRRHCPSRLCANFQFKLKFQLSSNWQVRVGGCTVLAPLVWRYVSHSGLDCGIGFGSATREHAARGGPVGDSECTGLFIILSYAPAGFAGLIRVQCINANQFFLFWWVVSRVKTAFLILFDIYLTSNHN